MPARLERDVERGAPRRRPGRRERALASACGPPGGAVAPSNVVGTAVPNGGGTITQPTQGFGAVLERTPAASAIARRMCTASSMGHVLVWGGSLLWWNYRTRFSFCRECLVRALGRHDVLEHVEQAVHVGDDRRVRRDLQGGLVVGAAQHADDRPGTGRRARLEVAHGVAHHGDRPRLGHLQARHRPEDQVGRRAAPAHVGRREGQVDLGPPAQGVHQRVPGGGGEAGGEADLDAPFAQGAQHPEGAGDLRHGTGGDARLVGGCELLRCPLRRRGLEEDREHVGFGPPHGVAHDRPGPLVLVAPRRDPDGRQRGPERGVDGAVVAHGRPRHVEAGEGEGPDHVATPAAARVSAAMAGAQVMPRPPGPVTIHTLGRICSRKHTAPSVHWA